MIATALTALRSIEPKRPVAILTALGLIVLALRWLLFPGLGPDDAEQMRYTQVLQWGYSTANPPLYTWTVWALQQIGGVGYLSLMAVKFALLAAFIAFTHSLARQISTDRTVIWAATVSPLLMAGIAWESVRAMSNTVLLLPAVAAFVTLSFAYLGRTDRRSLGLAFLCGAAMAVGLLAKASFALVVLAVALAAVSMRSFRSRLLSPPSLAILAVGIAPSVPYWLWLADRANFVVETADRKFGVGQGWGDIGLLFGTVGQLFESAFAFAVPFPIFAAAAVGLAWLARRVRADTGPVEPMDTATTARRFDLLGRTVLWLAVFALVLLPLSGSVRISPHHLAPLYLMGPWLVVLLATRSAGGRTVAASIYLCGTLMPVATVGGLLFEAYGSPQFLRTPHLSVSYEPLAEVLEETGADAGTVLAYDYPIVVSGNLRRLLPETPIASMLDPYGTEGPVAEPPSDRAGPCTVIGFDAPSHLYHLEDAPSVVALKFGTRPQQTPTVKRVSVPIVRSDGRSIPLLVIVYEEPVGECR